MSFLKVKQQQSFFKAFSLHKLDCLIELLETRNANKQIKI